MSKDSWPWRTDICTNELSETATCLVQFRLTLFKPHVPASTPRGFFKTDVFGKP